jgi:hypothetical protein
MSSTYSTLRDCTAMSLQVRIEEGPRSKAVRVGRLQYCQYSQDKISLITLLSDHVSNSPVFSRWYAEDRHVESENICMLYVFFSYCNFKDVNDIAKVFLMCINEKIIQELFSSGLLRSKQ